MWKDSIELKVIRLEGFPCSSTELALYIYFGDILHDQLLPITEEKSVVLPQEGTYRLEIINQNNQEEKSVSFERSLFKEDGVRWIPLFSPHKDFISEIPEEVLHPRILLIFYKKRMLSVAEVNLSVEEGEDEEKSCGLSQYEVNDEPLVSKVMNEDKLIGDYRNAIEYERKLRDEQERNMKKISGDLKDALMRSRDREDSLLMLVTQKEEELASAQNEISSLRAKVRKLELEKKQIEDLVECMKSEQECLNIEGLRSELQMFTEYFKDFEEFSELKARLDGYETKETEVKESENYIENYFKNKKVEAKKDKETVYLVNGKKISVCLRDGIIMFRSLGALQKIEEFFVSRKERSLTPSNRFHRKVVSEFKLHESESKESLTKRGNNTPLNLKRK